MKRQRGRCYECRFSPRASRKTFEEMTVLTRTNRDSMSCPVLSVFMADGIQFFRGNLFPFFFAMSRMVVGISFSILSPKIQEELGGHLAS
jgi:hypothetical protein